MNTRYSIALLSLVGLAACGGGGGGEGSENATVDRLEEEVTIHGPYTLFEIQLENGKKFIMVSADNNRMVVDSTSLPHGFSTSVPAQIRTVRDGTDTSESITLRGYRGTYANIYVTSGFKTILPEVTEQERSRGIFLYAVNETSTFDLPSSGQISYRGHAFNNNPANDARLDYTIDYGRRRGWGEISASKAQSRQLLNEASIRYNFDVLGDLSGQGVEDGVVKNDSGRTIGLYNVLIAGPNAEEIVGEVRYDHTDKELYFHGSR